MQISKKKKKKEKHRKVKQRDRNRKDNRLDVRTTGNFVFDIC